MGNGMGSQGLAVLGEVERGTADRGVPADPNFFFNPFPESDYNDLLRAAVQKVWPTKNAAVMAAAIQQANAKLSNHSLPAIPPSHEWDDLEKRLLYLRFYVEYIDAMAGIGQASVDDLVRSVMAMEVEFERDRNSHTAAYRALVPYIYGRNFRLPEPTLPVVEKEPELDPDTRAVIERNQVKEKLGLYMKSLSQGKAASAQAYATLVRAYIDTVSDLSVPLRQEYDDQHDRAIDHNWLEWLQANDFPTQYDHLFPVLYTLLNQARDLLKQNKFDQALGRLDRAQDLYDHLASMLYEYESEKVRKGTRVVITLMILKSISRMMLSVVVFKSVKGLVSQLAALITINLVYQQLDYSIGARERGLSAGDAVRDAALELLTMKITAKINGLLISRFNIDPNSISNHAMGMLTSTVISSMEEEFVKLGRDVNFVGFLKNLRDKFINPEFWVENIAVAVLARNFDTRGKTYSLPVNEGMARAATVATVLTFSPKASANTVAHKPVATQVASADPATGPAAAVDPAVTARATAATAVQPAAAAGTVRAPANTATDQSAPTQAQRGTDSVTLSPSPRSETPGPSPVTPLNTLGLLGLGAVVGRGSKKATILKLFSDAKKLLDKINDPEAKKEAQKRLDALRKEYDDSNDHTDTAKRIQAIRNKINEIFAEERIDFLLRYNLKSFGVKRILAKVAVPRRGNSGPEMVDMAYKVETTSGKIAFLIIESKYGRSTLGWVKYGRGEVQQFSPEWFEMRIEEIRGQDPKFADQLAESWKKGQILPFLMKVASDGSPKAFIDYTAEWTKYMAPSKSR